MTETPTTLQLRALDQIPVTRLKGVGAALAEKLSRLGLETVQDLLFHLPLRYQDRTRLIPMASLHPGMEGLVQGVVVSCEVVMGRRRSLVCRLRDESASLTLRFFHFSAAQKNALAPGSEVRCFGEARTGASGLELYHPEYRVLSANRQEPVEQSLTPIYPLTEGLTQTRLRSLCQQALELLDKQGGLTDWLPEGLRQRYRLPALEASLRLLHQPPVSSDLDTLSDARHPAQRRLAFEELLAHHLSLLKLRHQQQSQGAPRLTGDAGLETAFRDGLPFALTGAQERVVGEVAADLAQGRPMLRLVQGDVGSGKTVVAALAALRAVAAGYQAAIMAPTEILAEQHALNFRTWLQPLGLEPAWLAGKVKGKQRAAQLERIASGEAQVVVGTHALFQDEVQFARLGLVVVDEQHRFGVHQRLALKEKGGAAGLVPHQLIMTATPIPRTLTMSAYADLDCSIIDELPPGRTPIKTVLIGDSRRPEVVERVRGACEAGRQAYWVCTLIEESEALQCQAAEATAAALSDQLAPLRVGLVHGRMKAPEKAAVMARFKARELDLLVATTVIEVGVDVPNASLMIIENPERLGLAQLHQLRGRVGRGSVESFCVLMYQSPLSRQGRERLGVMRETNDGFRIAEKDLELRGPGEVLGTRQTGMMSFRVADLQRDADLLTRVKQVAAELYPHDVAREAIIRRWLNQAERYAQV